MVYGLHAVIFLCLLSLDFLSGMLLKQHLLAWAFLEQRFKIATPWVPGSSG